MTSLKVLEDNLLRAKYRNELAQGAFKELLVDIEVTAKAYAEAAQAFHEGLQEQYMPTKAVEEQEE